MKRIGVDKVLGRGKQKWLRPDFSFTLIFSRFTSNSHKLLSYSPLLDTHLSIYYVLITFIWVLLQENCAIIWTKILCTTVSDVRV